MTTQRVTLSWVSWVDWLAGLDAPLLIAFGAAACSGGSYSSKVRVAADRWKGRKRAAAVESSCKSA